jgi:hypothetical protein
MSSSEMLHRVTLVRTDVSEELSASLIGLTRSGELGTTRATRRNIPQDAILHILRFVQHSNFGSVHFDTACTIYETGKKRRYSCDRPWRCIGVSPVRYEHHLNIESKAVPVTVSGGL